MTCAPHSAATSRVESVDCESTTKISSAQATDSQAARIFSASLKVMIVAVIFIANSRFSIANFGCGYAAVYTAQIGNRQSAIGDLRSHISDLRSEDLRLSGI